MKNFILTAAATLGLAGCADFGPGNEIAGAELDAGGFGDATAINLATQSRKGHPGARPLNGKYAAVVFEATVDSAAPVSTTSNLSTSSAEGG